MSVGQFFGIELPWPDTPSTTQIKAAAGALGIEVSTTPTMAQIAQVTEVVELLLHRINRYASGAPNPIKREAMSRIHGYLRDAGTGAATSISRRAGNLAKTTRFQWDNADAFRKSGAKALLAPYRRRNAAIVRTSTENDE